VADSAPIDRYVGKFKFRVYFPSLSQSGGLKGSVNQAFVRVSGLATESEQMTYMQGTDNSVNTAPGRVKYNDVEFTRIYDGLDAFYAWRRMVERGLVFSNGDYRLDVAVELLRRDESVARSMMLRGAWPAKWTMPDFDATSSDGAFESFTLSVSEIYEQDPEELDK
jgi:phage tail-like protein